MASLRCMFLGDVVGRPGRSLFQKWAPRLKEKYMIDMLVVNGENSTDTGRGISPRNVTFFMHNGADVITSGNHIWGQREIYASLDERDDLIRPANFPTSCPGSGYALREIRGHTVAVVNVQGRSFMQHDLDCPFRTMDSLLTMLKTKTNVIFVDFHAETTSEKQAMGFYLDGRVSGVFGTHTHVQTADEKILPGGTSYITDLGFGGAMFSMLGMQKDALLKRFLTQMPVRFNVEKKGPMVMNGVWVEVDTQSGKALHIERVKIVDEDIAATF